MIPGRDLALPRYSFCWKSKRCHAELLQKSQIVRTKSNLSFSSRLAASKTLSPGSINPFKNLIRRIQFPLRIRGSGSGDVHNRHNHHCFPVGWTHSFITRRTPLLNSRSTLSTVNSREGLQFQHSEWWVFVMICSSWDYAVKSAVIVRYRTRFRQCECMLFTFM